MSEKIEKALAILLLATGIKLVEDGEKVKKRKKRSVWMKPWLKNRLRTSAYQNIFQELRLKDSEEFRRYLRMNTETYQVQILIYLFLYLFIYLKNYREKYFYSSQDPYYVMMHLLDFIYYGKLILY